MRISYEWLKSMVDVPDDPARLVDELVRTGTEVEGIEKVGADLEHVVTGQILEKEAHPDSDHMWVCKVDVGEKNLGADGKPEALQIVCGAQNFEAGDHVVVAMIGAVLPGDFKIKKSKLRGIDSCGMNCSERELGLGNDHGGIMILPKDAPVGVDFSDWYGLSDTVLDCEITPNRPDCLSMEGFAREVSAVLDVDTHIEMPSIQNESGDAAEEMVDIRIDDEKLCSRYVARVVRNVKIEPSPEWLAQRVIAAGSRPINNIVDVTNYVMYLTGQPLHAFDLGKLSLRDGKRHIVVRAAKDGEELTTLDGVSRKLNHDMALITDDGEHGVALAGVMGGENSEIDDSTVDVLLESACFDSGHISRTSRNLDLMSEASMRFERIVDDKNCASVADIAAALFESCCSATVAPGRVDVWPSSREVPELELRLSRIAVLAGDAIDAAFVEKILSRLGCTLERTSDDVFKVVSPSSRPDLVREVDLIEEVIRLWGMDKIEATLPAAKNHAGGLTLEQQRTRKISEVLRSSGLSETSTYCFADPKDLEKLKLSEEGRGIPVEILRPLVADESEMRRSMLPGLLRSLAYNLDHGVNNVQLFEIGRVFYAHQGKSLPDEPSYLCAVMCGSWQDDSWNNHIESLDFFDAKGVTEELLSALRITKVRYKAADESHFAQLQPGRGAEIIAEGESIGWVGNIHPQVLSRFGISVPVLAFEFPLASLLRLAKRELPFEDIPTLPSVDMDLALVLDENVSAEDVLMRIKSAGGKLLESAGLFDVYRDEKRLGKGKKSMAFALRYRSKDHTLTSEEAEAAHNRVVKKVCASTGGEVRS